MPELACAPVANVCTLATYLLTSYCCIYRFQNVLKIGSPYRSCKENKPWRAKIEAVFTFQSKRLVSLAVFKGKPADIMWN